MNAALRFPRLVVAGAGLWLVVALFAWAHPYTPAWPQVLTLLGAMVAVPAGLEVLRRQRVADISLPPAVWGGAWGLLALNMIAGGGMVTGISSLGWLGATVAIGWKALVAWRTGPRDAARAVSLCGPLMLPVGGAWMAADWLAIQPMGFNSLIVRLTAAHFHFAGFVLPLVAGLVMRERAGSQVVKAAGIGTVAGVPMVAIGITLTQAGAPVEVECVLALVFALCATAVGLALAGLAWKNAAASLAVRRLGIAAGLSLTAGMAFAILYALRPWLALPWLHLPQMWAWHGSIQVFGFALSALAAWLHWPEERSKFALSRA
jgi:hypothetical protein